MNKSFGRKLKELRFEKELTQVQLANIFNVSQHTISAWENNLQEPSIDMLKKMAKFFNVDMNELLLYEKDEIPFDIEKAVEEAKEQARKDRVLLEKKRREDKRLG